MCKMLIFRGEDPTSTYKYVCVEPKIGGVSPKLDGENNGKPHFLMDDLGGTPTIFRKHPFVPWKIVDLSTHGGHHGRP